jgi:hypothetical protein
VTGASCCSCGSGSSNSSKGGGGSLLSVTLALALAVYWGLLPLLAAVAAAAVLQKPCATGLLCCRSTALMHSRLWQQCLRRLQQQGEGREQ